MSGLQRLPKGDEAAVLELVRVNGLPVSKLRCEYSRQQGEGEGVSSRGRPYNISYDLMLCSLCGNLPDTKNNTPYCPHKLKALWVRLIEATGTRELEGDASL